MQLNIRNVSNLIINNNGLTDGLSLDQFNCYFNEYTKKELKKVGKIKKSYFYPNKKVWKRAVMGIIYENISKVQPEKINCIAEGIDSSNINFNCYLSKWKMRRILDRKLGFYKNKSQMTVYLRNAKNRFDNRTILEETYIVYLKELLSTTEDKNAKYYIKDDELRNKLLKLGLVTKVYRKSVRLTDKAMEKILMMRIQEDKSSINSNLVNTIEQNMNLRLINTPLKTLTVEVENEINKTHEIITKNIRTNNLYEDYIELVLRKKETE